MLLLVFRSRRIDVRSRWGFLRDREFHRLSSIFGAVRKYGSGWIGQAILIGWKCSATLTVKLNYAPNKNTSFFLRHTYYMGTFFWPSVALSSELSCWPHPNRWFKVELCLQLEKWTSCNILKRQISCQRLSYRENELLAEKRYITRNKESS